MSQGEGGEDGEGQQQHVGQVGPEWDRYGMEERAGHLMVKIWAA